MATAPNLQPEIHHLQRKPIADVEAIELQTPTTALALQRAPELVLEEAAKAAQALRDVIERKPNKCIINGKTFLQFEDWQTLGRFYGVTAAPRSTEYIEYGRVRGFEAHAEAILVSTGQVISGAQAMCLDDESKWSDKPLFQLRSMAQTRAAAKCLRNVLAWVVVMAGYSPTPAEEMDGDRPRQAAQPTQQSTRIPLPRVQQLCTRIAHSPNMAELEQNYLAAGREIQRANDRAALAAIVAAKDERKARLK